MCVPYFNIFFLGNFGVVRAYIASITTREQRTQYLSWGGAVQFIGFGLMPSVSSLFSIKWVQLLVEVVCFCECVFVWSVDCWCVLFISSGARCVWLCARLFVGVCVFTIAVPVLCNLSVFDYICVKHILDITNASVRVRVRVYARVSVLVC